MYLAGRKLSYEAAGIINTVVNHVYPLLTGAMD